MQPTCLLDGCAKPPATRGYCSAHYAAGRRNGSIALAHPLIAAGRRGETTQPDVCQADGCAVTKIKAGGLCGTHYDRRWREQHGAVPRIDKRTAKDYVCQSPEPCDRQSVARRDGLFLCRKHTSRHDYVRIDTSRPARRPVGRALRFCSTPGHETKLEHGASGLCQACYRRQAREAKNAGVERPTAVYAHRAQSPEQRNRVDDARRASNAAKTHCSLGHEYAVVGFRTKGRLGSRICMQCARDHATQTNRGNALSVKYDLTEAEYGQMLVEQNNVCAICQGPQQGGGIALAVDHDHACCPSSRTCGQCLRGLLCTRCNNGLGNLADNPSLLLRAAEYVLFYRQVHRTALADDLAMLRALGELLAEPSDDEAGKTS